jgi:hypothetical protein
MVPFTGRGREMHSSKRVNSPWYVAFSWLHSARMAAMWSSVRLPRSANGTPMASNSSSSQPTPMPSSMRPPDRWSRVASSLARTTGLRCGTMRMPVARRIVEVAEATQLSQIRGSGMSTSSPPGIFPDGS